MLNKIKINGKYLKDMLGIFELIEVDEKVENDPIHSISWNRWINNLKYYLVITYKVGNTIIKSQEIPIRGVYTDYFNGTKDYNIKVDIKDYLISEVQW